nr:SDR family oxidoreductase [Seonamhaeicola maritimus]
MDSNVLITGANRGLGLGFVKHYLRENNTVVACCRDKTKAVELINLESNYSYNLLIETLDVSNENSKDALVDRLKVRNLKFDLIINNAGVCIEENLGNWTKEGFQKTFEVNTIGVALFSQAIHEFLKEGGKLINMSSGMGSITLNINPEAALEAYAMSKAALNIFTARLSQKLLPRNIVTIALSPGWVQTDMGGEEAPATVDGAVADMVNTIDKLGLQESGKFLSETGEELPW